MNKAEIIKDLKNWEKKFDEVFNLFDHPIDGLSANENLKVISVRYSELKSRIVDYSKRLEKADKNGQLNADEQSILVPAIREVALDCSARRGSKNRQELVSSLYDASDYLSYYLSQIET